MLFKSTDTKVVCIIRLIEARVSTTSVATISVAEAAAAIIAKASSIAQATFLEATAAETTATATTTITGASTATVVARVAGKILQRGIDFLKTQYTLITSKANHYLANLLG